MSRVNLTVARVKAFSCDQGQAFLWDSDVAGLGVRATPKRKTYIVQSRLGGKTIRHSIADVGSIKLDDARTEARRLILLIEQGQDPRELEREATAKAQEARAARERSEAEAKAKRCPALQAWSEYLEDRAPKWSERHLKDHRKLSQDGAVERRKGNGLRKPGPLYPLLCLPLSDLTPSVLERWIEQEAADRPTQSRLALRLLQSFLNWCNEHPVYQIAINGSVITKKVKEALPKKRPKTDCLMKEQLAGWFTGVRQIQSPVIAAYLQALLLTGARKEELAGLKWIDIDFRWKSITIHDKVEGERIIPLTPFVESLLQFLPRRNEWVFSSPTAASGRLQEPFKAHNRALAIAGIDHLSLHGLRRSFGSLSEWCELPVGVVAQVMGHKPSATAERHYRVRPLDLLRKWHVIFEEWIIEQAGVADRRKDEKKKPLRRVANK